MKTGLCAFSGYKIYPAKGIKYVRVDGKHYTFEGSKSKNAFLARRNPRKILWTQTYRRVHKKGAVEEAGKKRTRKIHKIERAIVGASLDKIRQTRAEKPEVRQAAREAALREIKEKNKVKRDAKAKAAKAAPKTAAPAKGAAKPAQQPTKQKQPKVKQTKGGKR